MNIILFSNLFPNELEPERGNFVALMVSQLAKKISIRVISPLPWFPNIDFFSRFPRLAAWKKLGEIPKNALYKKIEVQYPKYFFLPKIGFIFQPISIYFSAYRLLKSLHKQGKLDIINAHWIYPDAVAAVYIAKKLGVPCVVSARGCDINHFSASWIRRIQIDWALHHADAITVVSYALEEMIVKIYGIERAKIKIIPNGVDSTIFHRADQAQCRASLKLTPDKKTLLFVGQLHPVKGVDTLLQALAILKNCGKLSFNTLIVGEGPLENPLHKLAKELQLSSSELTFKGQKSHTTVATYFGAADLLCLPSIREGRPNVIIEALATGLPVIASRVGGIPELVNEANGVLVPPSDPEQLAHVLAQAMYKSWDREGIAQGQTGLSWEGCAIQYMQTYSRVLDIQGNVK